MRLLLPNQNGHYMQTPAQRTSVRRAKSLDRYMKSFRCVRYLGTLYEPRGPASRCIVEQKINEALNQARETNDMRDNATDDALANSLTMALLKNHTNFGGYKYL